MGTTFSILNGTAPSVGLSGSTHLEQDGLLFSILNGTVPSVRPSGSTHIEQDGLLFSILNGTPIAPRTPSMPESTRGVFSDGRPARFDSAIVASALARGTQTINGHPVCVDSDKDGLCDEEERILGTDPFNADSDGDGYPDGLEVALGSDPLDANSVPNINPPGYLMMPGFSIRNAGITAIVPNTQGDAHVKQARTVLPHTDPGSSRGSLDLLRRN